MLGGLTGPNVGWENRACIGSWSARGRNTRRLKANTMRTRLTSQNANSTPQTKPAPAKPAVYTNSSQGAGGRNAGQRLAANKERKNARNTQVPAIVASLAIAASAGMSWTPGPGLACCFAK